MSSEIPGGPFAKSSVSVVIRNRNEAEYLGHVLFALANQSQKPAEIILVDNESSDSSIAVANEYGAQVVPLSRSEFTYGRALNIGIAASKGDIILLLSAHSLPIGPGFIGDGVRSLLECDAAAVCCRNIRFIDSNYKWSERHIMEWPITWAAIWDHTIESRGAFLRRSVWEGIRFREDLEASEDRQWSFDVLKAGNKIASSDAFYWYMRRQSMLDGIKVYQREMTAMYRIGGDIGHYSSRECAKNAFIAWKSAVRNTVDGLLRYAVFKTIPFWASRPPRKGSLR
jgi:glycosyltransferase involved in cell wall biosynthesis